MAGDWIALRLDLDRDEDVIVVASILDMPETHVVGLLHRFWSWMSEQTTNGYARGVTETWMDRYIGVSGFCDSLHKVGWLDKTAHGIQVHDFDAWMSKTAKNRLQSRIRMIKHRNKCDDPGVTNPSPDVDVDVDSSEPAAQAPKPAKKPPKVPKKKRQPDPVWDTVVALWFPSGATGREKRIGKLVRQFKGVGATETLLRERHAMYKKHWPGIDCTPDALFKHWDQIKDKSHVGETGTKRIPGRIETPDGKYDELEA